MSESVDRSTPYDDAKAIFEVGSSAPIAEDPRAVGQAFDRMEEDFGRFLDQSLQPRGRESLDDLLARANPPRGGVAVDIGSGRGRDVVALATQFRLHVHGVDPSPVNIGKAKQRAADAGLQSQTELLVGRAEEIPLPDASVDVLWCKEAITFTDLDAAMREFHRATRPGAVGVIYQVLTGLAMTASEAEWLTAQEMGFGPGKSFRPDDVEEAIRTGGFELSERINYAGEWGEAGEEGDRAAGRRLLHASRLIRLAPAVHRPLRHIELPHHAGRLPMACLSHNRQTVASRVPHQAPVEVINFPLGPASGLVVDPIAASSRPVNDSLAGHKLITVGVAWDVRGCGTLDSVAERTAERRDFLGAAECARIGLGTGSPPPAPV